MSKNECICAGISAVVAAMVSACFMLFGAAKELTPERIVISDAQGTPRLVLGKGGLDPGGRWGEDEEYGLWIRASDSLKWAALVDGPVASSMELYDGVLGNGIILEVRPELVRTDVVAFRTVRATIKGDYGSTEIALVPRSAVARAIEIVLGGRDDTGVPFLVQYGPASIRASCTDGGIDWEIGSDDGPPRTGVLRWK